MGCCATSITKTYPIRMDATTRQAQQAIQNAQTALQQGNKRAARRWAEKAVALAPEREEPWLLLAALATPKASLAYLNQALAINPQSRKARQGMHWAIQRYRKSPQPQKQVQIVTEIGPEAFIRPRPAPVAWLMVIFILLASLGLWLSTPMISAALASQAALAMDEGEIQKSTVTPSPTITFTPSPTSTPSPSPTATNTPTATLPPTDTPTPTATFAPTNTPEPTAENAIVTPEVILPPGVEPTDRWIDVDLTHQRAYAYLGKELINYFIISTGTAAHPTVTGQYKIYVKYRYANMAGPGYYLPDVPYVMYFYKGYGIHGTYWHDNFGTPMSHGCVNFRTVDAGWMYDFASVGTIVNIHY